MSAEFVIHEEHFTKKNSLEKKFGLDDVNKKKEVIVYCPTVPSLGVTKYPPILKKKEKVWIISTTGEEKHCHCVKKKVSSKFSLEISWKIR